MNSDHRKALGEKGERLAVEFLEEEGYRILARNFTTKIGEIDIVASMGGLLIFVEVRTSISPHFGPPQYSINREKRLRIRRVAGQFLSIYRDYNRCRFDVITLTGSEGNLSLDHIPSAF